MNGVAVEIGCHVRCLLPYEAPTGLWPDMPELHIDSRWAWAAVDAFNEVQAALLTAPAHGAVILLRIWKRPAAPALVLRQLFREAARECSARGLTAWLVMLDGNRREELKLARLALQMGGLQVPVGGLLCSGRLEDVWNGCH